MSLLIMYIYTQAENKYNKQKKKQQKNLKICKKYNTITILFVIKNSLTKISLISNPIYVYQLYQAIYIQYSKY